MKHEKSISREALRAVREAADGGILEKKNSWWGGVKDCRVTSRHRPKVVQAQSTRRLCLSNDFTAIVASSLVNGEFDRHLTFNDL